MQTTPRTHKTQNRTQKQHQSTKRDPSISELNSEITSIIQTQKSDMWREHLQPHWDHKRNTHTLWKTIHGLANKTPTQLKNNIITFKRENTHFTHTDSRHIQQTIHQHSQT